MQLVAPVRLILEEPNYDQSPWIICNCPCTYIQVRAPNPLPSHNLVEGDLASVRKSLSRPDLSHR